MTPTLLFDDVSFMFDPTFFPVVKDPVDDVLDPASFPVDEDPGDDVDILDPSDAVPFCTTR